KVIHRWRHVDGGVSQISNDGFRISNLKSQISNLRSRRKPEGRSTNKLGVASMVICPFCGEENIDGADSCETCQQSLEFLSKPKPGSDLERSLLKDRVKALAPRQPVVVEPSTPV